MMVLRYGSTDISSLCVLIWEAFIISTYTYSFATEQVCGHRWKYRGFDSGPDRYVQGKCLVSGRLLRDFHLVLPCTQGEDSECVAQMHASHEHISL